MPMHHRQYLIFFTLAGLKSIYMIINRKIPIGMKELCFHASLNKMHCLRTHSFYFICESYVFMYLFFKHGHLILFIWYDISYLKILNWLLNRSSTHLIYWCKLDFWHFFWKTVCWVNLKFTKSIQFMLTCGSINYHWWKFNREGLITEMVLW